MPINVPWTPEMGSQFVATSSCSQGYNTSSTEGGEFFPLSSFSYLPQEFINHKPRGSEYSQNAESDVGCMETAIWVIWRHLLQKNEELVLTFYGIRVSLLAIVFLCRTQWGMTILGIFWSVYPLLERVLQSLLLQMMQCKSKQNSTCCFQLCRDAHHSL